MISLRHIIDRRRAKRIPVEEMRDVSIVVRPEDFPGNERIVNRMLPELYETYRETAEISSLLFCRGSVLKQEAQEFTEDMLWEILKR